MKIGNDTRKHHYFLSFVFGLTHDRIFSNILLSFIVFHNFAAVHSYQNVTPVSYTFQSDCVHFSHPNNVRYAEPGDIFSGKKKQKFMNEINCFYVRKSNGLNLLNQCNFQK